MFIDSALFADDESIPIPFLIRVLSLRPFAAVTTQIRGSFTSFRLSNDADLESIYVVWAIKRRKKWPPLRRRAGGTTQFWMRFAPVRLADGAIGQKAEGENRWVVRHLALGPSCIELFFPSTLTCPADILSRSRERGIPVGAREQGGFNQYWNSLTSSQLGRARHSVRAAQWVGRGY